MTINCADAITLITGRLCVPIERLYELYNEFLDDNLYTHQLPRAGRYADPIVREQLTQLSAYLDRCAITPENWEQEVAKAKECFGDQFEITTAAQGWRHIHALDEPILQGKDVIFIEAPGNET